MSGIFWAASAVTAVTGVVAAVTWGSWGRDTRVLAAFLIGLPLSALVNPFVKTPVTLGIERLTWPSVSGAAPWRFLWLVLWVAPLAEEAVKLLPLAVPDIRRSLALPRTPFRIGMAAGAGFGLGEAWYLAWGISRTAAYSSVSLPYLVSFFSERLIITFAHGVMTSVAVSGFAGKSALGGYAMAIGLHAFVNAGSLAYQAGLIGSLGRSVATLASIIVLAIAFARVRDPVIV